MRHGTTSKTIGDYKIEGGMNLTVIVTVVLAVLAPLVVREIGIKAVTPAIGALATTFQLPGERAANNIKVNWNLLSGAAKYQVFRSTNANFGYTRVATVPGNTFDDYGLEIGRKSYYQVQALDGTETILEQSTKAHATTYIPNDTYVTYDNTMASSLKLKSNLESDEVYYQYNYIADANGFSEFIQQTSTDGFTFAGRTSVLSRAEVCASVASGFCKLESVNIVKNPSTGNFVLWAHFENNKDYVLAQVAVAEAVPGRPFTFIGTYQPEGHQSRDLSFFGDTDGIGYLISTANDNQDLNLYKLASNWTTIDSQTNTLYAGLSREAPSMQHVGEHYYLFTSNTAGWYPSQGLYISAMSLSGLWSEAREIGNTANFGAQSGGTIEIGTQFAMVAYRWGAQWKYPEPSNSGRMLPISFNNGYATYGFYEIIKYGNVRDSIVPVQSGKILSIGKPSNNSGLSMDAPGDTVTYSASKANDGTQSNIDNYYKSQTVPFWWEVDLQRPAVLSQIDLTTKMVKGSETYYSYVLQGSLDGETYTTLVDNTANTAVGFVSNRINSTDTYRYIRINVSRVVNVQNGNSADWARGIHELLVYGSEMNFPGTSASSAGSSISTTSSTFKVVTATSSGPTISES